MGRKQRMRAIAAAGLWKGAHLLWDLQRQLRTVSCAIANVSDLCKEVAARVDEEPPAAVEWKGE